ncbi:acetyl-CoA synthetase-like protein [Thozetella sp. PMI_491]|nr:acetyl-CoA synthetase-like protein [Thozetella sp. PMI_491]
MQGRPSAHRRGAIHTHEYGQRLLVSLIDDRAATQPDREWVYIPNTSDPKDGWKKITFAQLASAVNRVAHRIVDTIGRQADGEFPTIAYLGPNDVRYQVFALGAVKAGAVALFISPRNSMEGQLNLFNQTKCNVLCFDASFQETVQPWLQEREMQAIMVNGVDELFGSDPVPPFPYQKTFAQGEWDPFVILHTSGSTGLPKPVVVRQGMVAISDRYHLLPEFQGAQVWTRAISERATRLFIAMPLFHIAGLLTSMIYSLYWDLPVVLGVGSRPLSSGLIVESLKHCGCDAMFAPPAILEEMSQDSESTKLLAKLAFVGFGGGNLAPDSGNRLVQNGATLLNLISSTEFLPYPYYWQNKKENWQYFVINDEVLGADWQQTEDGVYEQVIVRREDKPRWQGFFYTFPNAKEYRTKDLYKRHPTEPGNWIYHGRADDIIVFSNGEKLNPVTIEGIVADHPSLKGALVVGNNRFQPTLILEPVTTPEDDKEAKQLVDSVWPLVVKANKESVAHGQIGRNFILLAHPQKPFHRAGKGTVQRASTVKLYSQEIDTHYEKVENVASTEVIKLDLSSIEALTKSIINLFVNSLGTPKIDPSSDFFAAGIDSMHVINASRLLRGGLEAAGVHVDASALATRVIYGNPTATRLAEYIYSVARGGGTGGEAHHELQVMQALLDKYTRDLPAPRAGKPSPADEGQVILITGTTGALGSYLLDFASASSRVKKIICLNRAEDGRSRQAQASMDRGLSTDFAKAEFLHADMSSANLGLSKADYENLLRTVDRVIHNQWPVNFNLSTDSFEPHIRGVRHLADFSVLASKSVPITFISSIGTLDNWKYPEPVPEQSIPDLENPGTGYGRSKLVSSLILEKATEVSGVPTVTIRVGQIGGPRSLKGWWNRQEWVPSLVASSVYLGMLPDNFGPMSTVDWLPMEDEAKLVLEVSGITAPVPLGDIRGYFHGVNPAMVHWKDLAPSVKEFYGSRITKLVSMAEWVDALEQSQSATEDVNKNPGVKLLDTYRGMLAAAQSGGKHVQLSMNRTKRYSETARKSQPVTPELIKNWCRQWEF